MEANQSNFIRDIIVEDLKSGKHKQIVTRFPPEPNGYLHIGHAKAICLNFGLAKEFSGKVNLRFDDTNPAKEEAKYIEAIKEDIKWLGFNWDNLYFASDYFDTMFECAMRLIKKGLAYVDDLSAQEIKEYRGTLTTPGKNSPYRNRSTAENVDLFEKMRLGEFQDGQKVLRAKIDMSSPNINLRDPVIYRIAHIDHHNVGNKWCIYPMYTFAHPLEDAIEGITHSLCSLEFEDQRPFYLWVNENCDMSCQPMQYEFGRLSIKNTVTSKRKLKSLIDLGYVSGWDDPRMPTLSGYRRRGYTPSAIRAFINNLSVSKSQGTVEQEMLDHFIREDLKLSAKRTMAVLNPLKVIITNYPEGKSELLEAEVNPENPSMGKKNITFDKIIYIERDDFMEDAPKNYFRLSLGKEVRLKNAYFIRCEKAIKNENGEVIEIHCTYDPLTKSGSGFTERKVKGTIHWIAATEAAEAEFRLYDNLLLNNSEVESLLEDNFELSQFNNNSLIITQGFVAKDIELAKVQEKFQLFRHGYFNIDPVDSTSKKPVLNRIVSLKSSYNPSSKAKNN